VSSGAPPDGTPGALSGVFLSLALLAGCATNPVTGEREVSLMSPAQEAQLGRQAAAQVEQEIGLVADPGLTAYVQALGQRLAARSPRQDVGYQFRVADMPEPNAFALPGGYIYVSRGLLALTNSEAELANVVGHEIGHVAARHAAQRQTRATGVGIATVLGTILAGVAGGNDAARAAAELGQAAGAGLIASYGRDQERQSDDIGQRLAAESGWDPRAMSSFLASLERDTGLRTGGTPRPGYLDSHPALGERVRVTAERAATLTVADNGPIAGEQADFLRRIDGVLIGDDPRNGFFRDGAFVHPDLAFSLQLPAGWMTQNQRAAVLAAPRERDALIRLELQGQGTDPRAAAVQFAQANQVRFEAGQDLRVGGYAAFRALARAEASEGPLGLDMTWIAHPAGIFRITGMAPFQRFNAYAATFQSTARSFAKLPDKLRAQITELRLRAVQARRGETLEALSQRTGNKWSVERTAIANGLSPSPTLRAGQWLKIARAEPYSGD
jgi:predicted Zn-dependent protease